MTVFDNRPCELGEGPLWHPGKEQLFWFDIVGKRLLTRSGIGATEWRFDEHVSAAGWVDEETLLVASESALSRFEIGSGRREILAPLEADTPVTRSNDGRADPQGGFWIGTMGKSAAPGAGAIYRYYRGEVRKLHGDWTIPNAICFSPDGLWAYLADTPSRQILRVRVNETDGWPKGDPEVHIDLRTEQLNPDGAVVDASGVLWNAQWGASRVAAYGPDGQLRETVSFPATQISCPAFGGHDLKTLFATSAGEGLDDEARVQMPLTGQTFATETTTTGQAEHRVLLG